MLPRHAIADPDWDRVKDLLPGRPGTPGRTARDNRRFVDAVLWVGKTGLPWRDLPARFGPWNSVGRRFDRRARRGVWAAVFAALPDPDLEWRMRDSTVVRAHPCAAGAKKKATAPAGRTPRGRAAAGAGSAASPTPRWTR